MYKRGIDVRLDLIISPISAEIRHLKKNYFPSKSGNTPISVEIGGIIQLLIKEKNSREKNLR
jgi:hypothetical protein